MRCDNCQCVLDVHSACPGCGKLKREVVMEASPHHAVYGRRGRLVYRGPLNRLGLALEHLQEIMIEAMATPEKSEGLEAAIAEYRKFINSPKQECAQDEQK